MHYIETHSQRFGNRSSGVAAAHVQHVDAAQVRKRGGINGCLNAAAHPQRVDAAQVRKRGGAE